MRRCSGRGMSSSISGPRGMGKTRLAAELAREVRGAGRRSAIRELRRRRRLRGCGARRGRCGNDARAARPRRPGRRGRGAPRRRAPCRARCRKHAGTRARYLTNGVSRCSTPGASGRSTPMRSPSWPRSIAGEAAVALPLDAVLDETGGVPLAGSGGRCRVASRRGEPPPRGSCAARRGRPSGAAGRPGRPHEQRRRPPAGSRTESRPTSRPPSESVPSRAWRASTSRMPTRSSGESSSSQSSSRACRERRCSAW